jgi:hypothetical protein
VQRHRRPNGVEHAEPDDRALRREPLDLHTALAQRSSVDGSGRASVMMPRADDQPLGELVRDVWGSSSTSECPSLHHQVETTRWGSTISSRVSSRPSTTACPNR